MKRVVANGSSRYRERMCLHPKGTSHGVKKSGTAEAFERFRLFAEQGDGSVFLLKNDGFASVF